MDPSQYKHYVLVLLFVKYVSDKYANDPYGLIKIPVDGGFKDLQALKGKMEIGETLRDTVTIKNDSSNIIRR